MVSIHAIISDELKHELEEVAQKQHLSLSEVIRMRLSNPTPYMLPTEEEAGKEFYETSQGSWDERME